MEHNELNFQNSQITCHSVSLLIRSQNHTGCFKMQVPALTRPTELGAEGLRVGLFSSCAGCPATPPTPSSHSPAGGSSQGRQPQRTSQGPGAHRCTLALTPDAPWSSWQTRSGVGWEQALDTTSGRCWVAPLLVSTPSPKHPQSSVLGVLTAFTQNANSGEVKAPLAIHTCVDLKEDQGLGRHLRKIISSL